MLAGTGLSISTWDFTTPFLCRVAIFLCLSFYIGNKSLVYLYLVERIHELRNKRRTKDYVWYIGILIVVGGFTTVATFAYMNVVDAASNVNNRCRIGLHNLETLLLLGYDVTINVSLTVVFTAQSWQWFRYLPLKSQLATLVSSIPNALRKEKLLATSLQEYKAEVLKVIISKSLFGAVAIMLPTVANQVVLYKLNGHEQAWLCFTACTLDGPSPFLCSPSPHTSSIIYPISPVFYPSD